MTDTSLNALAPECSLKSTPAESSSELIAEHVFEHLRARDVACKSLRCADFDIAPGVEANMGEGDQWPGIREQIVDDDIVLLSTPLWLGHPSSIMQRVLEPLDAELSNTDDGGRPAILARSLS